MLYLMLIYQDDAAMKSASPEEQRALGEEYGEFNQFLAQSGALKGTAAWPSGATTLTRTHGKPHHQDGAYAGAGANVAGFFLIEVENLETAKTFAEKVPGVQFGAVEIRPVSN